MKETIVFKLFKTYLHDPEATKYQFYAKEQLFSNDFKLTYMILKLFSSVLTQKGT